MAREEELKYELSEQAYHALLGLATQEGETQKFCNGYYVTAQDTGRRDWVLRLRQGEQGPGELTLKIGRRTGPGTFSSEEYTALVESRQPDTWESTEPLQVFRREISRDPLLLQGESHNERRVLAAPMGPVAFWELDRTTLPNGKVFHELEIEYPAESSPTPEQIIGFRHQLEDWIFDCGLQAVPSQKTKYRRFLEAVGFHR